MKRMMTLMICLLLSLVLSACSLPWQRKSEENTYDGYVYYLNDDHTDLVREGFEFDGKTGQALADDITSRLSASADDEHDSPLPDGVVIESTLIEDGKLQVYLNALFTKASQTEQTLCRAALVESYIQIRGVDGILFYVDKEPMTDEDGNDLDALDADDFLYDVSIYPERAHKLSLALYYGDASAEKLKRESVAVRTNGEKPPVRIIAERLIEGPAFEEESALLPEDARVINAGIVGDTAYINFNKGFADTNISVAPELCVYSVVNSVIENTEAKQVQIQIEGKSPASYGGQIDLRQPLKAKKSLAK